MLRLGKKIIKMSGGGMTALSIAAATMIASGAFMAGDEASAVNPSKRTGIVSLSFRGPGGVRTDKSYLVLRGPSPLSRTRSMSDLNRDPRSSSYSKTPNWLPKSESKYDLSVNSGK